jgi:hypothetical protein
MIHPPQTLPENSTQVLYWRISDRPSWVIWVNLLSVALFVVWIAVFGWLASTLGKLSSFEITFNLNVLIALAGCLLILVLHELVHGLAMWLFGAHPQYGVLWKQMMFYATSPGYPFSRNQYLIVALAPFVVISLVAALLISLLAGSPWTLLIALLAAINASGAIGDQWMSAIVMRYPAGAYVMDERDGMRIFLQNQPILEN